MLGFYHESELNRFGIKKIIGMVGAFLADFNKKSSRRFLIISGHVKITKSM
jgi:hypothetical protein